MGLVDNAADRRQGARAKKAKRAELLADQNSLRVLLSTSSGRRAAWLLISETRFLEPVPPYQDTPHGFGLLVGLREAGVKQLELLRQIDPSGAAAMIAEADKRRLQQFAEADAGRRDDEKETEIEGEAHG